MAKQKSQKTLTKEAEWAERVKYYEKSVSLDQDFQVGFSALPGKFKSDYPNVLTRKIRLDSYAAAYYRKLKAYLIKRSETESPYLSWNKMDQLSYIFGDFKETIVTPLLYVGSEYDINDKKLHNPIIMRKGDLSPIMEVAKHPFPDEATAIEWPDEMGVTTLYFHTGSKLARERFPKVADKVGDGLNRESLNGVKSWDLLAEYIYTRKSLNLNIPQQTICDIVRKISTNISAAEVEKMVKMQNKAESKVW